MINIKNKVQLGDVVIVGYGFGDYPKLRVARVIKTLPWPSGYVNKFRIRFIPTGEVAEYGSERGVIRYEKDIIKNFGAQNGKYTLKKLVKQFKKEYRQEEKLSRERIAKARAS